MNKQKNCVKCSQKCCWNCPIFNEINVFSPIKDIIHVFVIEYFANIWIVDLCVILMNKIDNIDL